MTERSAKNVASAFAFVSALLIPIAPFLGVPVLTPTLFGGSTLVMIYLIANPRLLIGSHAEQRQVVRSGPAVPIALVLGILLMIIGLLQAALTP